jgi:hypothetical protein
MNAELVAIEKKARFEPKTVLLLKCVRWLFRRARYEGARHHENLGS